MRAVLIVDDNRAFRTVLRTLFEEAGGFDKCVEAANASEALDKAKQLSPNLAVVDCFNTRNERIAVGSSA